MREVGGIIYISEDKINVNSDKFYDNLKLSLSYREGYDKFGIYSNSTTYFRNAILEIFEHLNKGVSIIIDNREFLKMGEFSTWLYSKNNLYLGVEKHKEFIDGAYSKIEDTGLY